MTSWYYRAHGSLGNVFLRQGRIKEAIEQFQNALRLNPNDTTARDNLERIRRSAGEQAKPQ